MPPRSLDLSRCTGEWVRLELRPKLAEKIARIIGDVQQKNDKKWLSGRLKNAEEPSLEERLFLTFSELDIDLDANALRAWLEGMC